MADQIANIRYRAIGADGLPIAGAKLGTFEAGTTTPITTYTDSGLSIPHANPVVADSGGLFPQIFLAADDYKFVLDDADDVEVWTQDNVNIAGTLTFTGGLTQDGTVVSLTSGVNNQTGTTYTIVANDRGKLITFSNASAIACTLPAAGASFPDGFFIDIENRNDGILTVTSASNIDGNSSVSLNRNEGLRIFSDGSTYYSQRGAIRDLFFKDGGELTIASGAVTVTDLTYYTINTEADAASDDLATINGTIDAKIITLAAENAARTVVLKHNTGNIYNPQGSDITLGDVYSNVTLRYESDLSRWVVVGKSLANNLQLDTAQESTSGTEIDFTGLPANIRELKVMFEGVSTSGNDDILIQLGTGSTTYVASGYVSRGALIDGAPNVVASTAGIIVVVEAAGDVFHGAITFNNFDADKWVAQGSLANETDNQVETSAGSVDISATLTAVRVTTVGGTDTFDAGNINLIYTQ